MSASEIAETTDDRFLGDRVALRQPVRGHRAGLDAALLQAAIPDGAGGHVVDIGTGCGAVAFSVAARSTGVRVTGFDDDPAILSLARAGLALPANAGFAERIRLVELDAGASRRAREAAGLHDDCADWIVMNPPYDEAAATRASPDPLRRRAHVVAGAGIDQWFRCASGLLRPGGRLAVIHRAARIGDILAAAKGRFGSVRILPFHPREGEAAKRVVVAMVHGSAGPPSLLPGIVVHSGPEAYSGPVAGILAGQKTLALW